MNIKLEDGFRIQIKHYQENHLDGKYIKTQFGFHWHALIGHSKLALIGKHENLYRINEMPNMEGAFGNVKLR